MSSQRLSAIFFALSFALSLSPVLHAAGSSGGGGGGSFSNSTSAINPERRSEQSLKAGIKQRDKAHKQEAKAAAAKNDKVRDKALAKAQKYYARAVKKQGEALKLNPRNYKAANELGYALRKTGDYRKAIGAYNYALELNPNFHKATEYRGEAFLALGMMKQTKQSYMILFRDDRELANQLMTVFDAWVIELGDDMDEAQSTFAKWVEERKRMAKMTSDLSMNNTRTW